MARHLVTMYGVVQIEYPEIGPMALFDVRHLAETWVQTHLPSVSCIAAEEVEIHPFTLTIEPATKAEAEELEAQQAQYESAE